MRRHSTGCSESPHTTSTVAELLASVVCGNPCMRLLLELHA